MSGRTGFSRKHAGTGELEIIEFQLRKLQGDGSEKIIHYGIDVAHVREIIKPPQITEYPNSHPCVTGIFNLRGKLIPLINLGQWIGNVSTVPAENKRVIVAEINGQYSGFEVDDVSRIYRINRDVLEEATALMQGAQDCVLSVARMEDRLILLLNFALIIENINPHVSRAHSFTAPEYPDLPELQDDSDSGVLEQEDSLPC